MITLTPCRKSHSLHIYHSLSRERLKYTAMTVSSSNRTIEAGLEESYHDGILKQSFKCIWAVMPPSFVHNVLKVSPLTRLNRPKRHAIQLCRARASPCCTGITMAIFRCFCYCFSLVATSCCISKRLNVARTTVLNKVETRSRILDKRSSMRKTLLSLQSHSRAMILINGRFSDSQHKLATF